uniref:Uncharacterized protein n=1 Tax=Zea mays TaxID=4577 RepID=A0A804NZ14_MAIZE
MARRPPGYDMRAAARDGSKLLLLVKTDREPAATRGDSAALPPARHAPWPVRPSPTTCTRLPRRTRTSGGGAWQGPAPASLPNRPTGRAVAWRGSLRARARTYVRRRPDTDASPPWLLLLILLLVVLHGRAGTTVVRHVVVVVVFPAASTSSSRRLGDAERRRHVRRRGAAEQGPVDAGEEGVALDGGGADGGAEAAGGVLGEERGDEVAGGGRRGRVAVPGELERAGHDVGQRHLVVVALEGRSPVQQLEDEDPQRPPVHGAAVPFPGHDLGSQVLVRAHERRGPQLHRLRHELQLQPAVVVRGRFLARAQPAGPAAPAPAPAAREELEAGGGRHDAGGGDGAGGRGRRGAARPPRQRQRVGDDVRRRRRRRVALERQVEVGQHDVAVPADQHVLRLQVAVHDVHHVDVLQRRHHLRRVEPATTQAVGVGSAEKLCGAQVPVRSARP